jgi:uncharacterized protein YajQ (UPF0234 family)
MAQQNSFDIVSKIDFQEIDNALNQVMKEVKTRFDFKGSKSQVSLDGKEKMVLISDDEFKLKSLNEILQQKLVKRAVPLKALKYGKALPAADSTVRQEVDLQQGIPVEKSREIVKLIKETKLKVQASIQGDFVRVSGRDRDVLQEVIRMLKSREFDFDLQFANYRSN